MSAEYFSDEFYLNEFAFTGKPSFLDQTIDPLQDPVFSRPGFRRKNAFHQIFLTEKIHCMIISTYSLEIDCIWDDFPQLFQANYSIPCVILHGDRGRSFEMESATQTRTSSSSAVKKDDYSIKQEKNEEQTISTPIKAMQATSIRSIPSTMRIFEVLPQHITNKKARSMTNATGSTGNTQKKHRQIASGVHHPKYLFVFTDRGLHLMISTANFTGNHSLDGTWTQFFPMFCKENHPNIFDEYTNDFGMVLQDFLGKQSEQIVINNQSPKKTAGKTREETQETEFDLLQWIRQHTGNLDSNLEECYDFSQTTVKLVSTVPSRKPAPVLSRAEILALYDHYKLDMLDVAPQKCGNCLWEETKLISDEENHISYGSLRVKELLLSRNHRWPR
jgi:hypothetical protein